MCDKLNSIQFNPNSKIYNKLLFVCGDKKIRSESYKLPHIFPQIRLGVVMERTSSLTAKKFGKGYF
jgi:hypothetical protein